jgi:hypothetical protein
MGRLFGKHGTDARPAVPAPTLRTCDAVMAVARTVSAGHSLVARYRMRSLTWASCSPEAVQTEIRSALEDELIDVKQVDHNSRCVDHRVAAIIAGPA